MTQFLNFLFSVDVYEDRLDRFRARVIYGISSVMFVSWMLYAFTVPEWDGQFTMFEAATSGREENLQAAVGFYSVIFLTIAIFITNRLGLKLFARWAPFALWYATGVVLIAAATNSPAEPGSPIILLMVLGALLNGTQGIIAGLGLSLPVIFLLAANGHYDEANISLGNIVPQYLSGSIVVYLFLRYARLFRSESVAEAISNRNITADFVAQIARTVSKRTTLDELLEDIVTRVVDNFDFVYHAQVFLVADDGETAKLAASTGEVGQQLIENAHALDVGSQSVIGQVTQHGDPIIAHAGARDSIHRRNELLPDTAVEAAFALRVGDRIIGALDLQSRNANAFDSADVIATFQALADSTSLAIDNVSQFERAQTQIRRNEKLAEQERQTAREVEKLNQRLTGLAWSDYLSSRKEMGGLDADFHEGAVSTHNGNSWTRSLSEAVQINQLVQSHSGDKQTIAVPLRLRGQVVGALEFELDSDQEFSPEDLDLLQEVSDRFGLAAENARLVDESQRVAQREALVNQLSSRMQLSNTVENTLKETARGLHEAFKAERVSIRLGIPSDEPEKDGV